MPSIQLTVHSKLCRSIIHLRGMRFTITRWGQIRGDAGDIRHQTVSVSGAGGWHCSLYHCSLYLGITFLRGSFSPLITEHLPTHAAQWPRLYCANIDQSLNTPSVILFTMGSKYLPSPVCCRVIIKKPHFLAPATILPADTWPTCPGSWHHVWNNYNHPIETRESRQSTNKNHWWCSLQYRLVTGLRSLSLVWSLEKYGWFSATEHQRQEFCF